MKLNENYDLLKGRARFLCVIDNIHSFNLLEKISILGKLYHD